MTRSRLTARLLGTGLLALAMACAPPQPPDNRAQDETTLREADMAFAAAAAAGNLDEAVAFYAEDAVTQAPNAPPTSGAAAIRAQFEQMFATPGFKISWQPTKVEVSRSGDLGYTIGTATMSMTGPDGSTLTEEMKYTTVWRKGADGNWKVVVDAFSSNAPAPAGG